MAQKSSRVKDLKAGDLVTHILYGREWIGIIISFKEDKDIKDKHSERALVQIQPGTKYELFFEEKVIKKHKVSPSLGYVSTSWLFKIK